jgi:hypothetical protein
MRTKIYLLMFSSTLAAASVVTRADTCTFIIITAASSTTQGATFDINRTLPGKPDPRIPSTIDPTAVIGSGQGYTFTGIVPIETDHTIAFNDLLYTRPTAKHVDAEGDRLDLNSSIGISLVHVYDNDGYHVDVFDPHDPVDITPFTIGPLSLTLRAIPEPSSLMLFGIGILSLAAIARRRFRRL